MLEHLPSMTGKPPQATRHQEATDQLRDIRQQLDQQVIVQRERRRAEDLIREERRDALSKTIRASDPFGQRRRFREESVLRAEREDDERRWRARLAARRARKTR